MMTCRDVYGFLDEFIEGALDASTRQNFERHLDRCLSCRKYLATYRATLVAARGSELADTPATGDAPEDLVRAIVAARTAAFMRQPPE